MPHDTALTARHTFRDLSAVRLAYQDRYRLTMGAWEASEIRKVNVGFAQRVGAAYDALPEYDRDALPAYEALAREVMLQADFLSAAGYTFSFWTGEGEPYADSDAMRVDLHTHKHLCILPTAGAFGETAFKHHYGARLGVSYPIVKDYCPMLRWDMLRSTPATPVLINDLFRWVHDVFGHGINPHQFGPLGEDNAYREHATMFSPLALSALTSETRGQNSWVNYGPHMFRPDGTLPKKTDPDWVSPRERQFAPQKMALLPQWACHE